MNIITKQEIEGRLEDGIKTLLGLEESDFQKVIEQLKMDKNKMPETISFYYTTDKCELPDGETIIGLEDRKQSKGYYTSRTKPSMFQIFEALKDISEKSPQDSKENLRSQLILQTRNIEALKSMYVSENGENVELINVLFKVLQDDNYYGKFLKYEENKECFSVEGKETRIQEYFKLLGEIFGNKDKNGNLSKGKTISLYFYIPQLEQIEKRVLDIYQKFNVDRYVDPKYEFKQVNSIKAEKVIRKGEEPEWNIHPEVYEAIYKDMPEDLSLEEKGFYIYTKLCSIFEYDEEYQYKNKGISATFKSDFSKEHLESLKPGSKITCFEFSRMFSKLVNEIDGDIEAVVISQGANRGHFLAGFYTDKISVRLEAINTNLNGKEDPTNDIMKSKNGIKLRGIQTISDREGVINNALNKVYQCIYGKEPLSIKEFVLKLKGLPQPEIPDDVEMKLQSFIEAMKQRGIVGNEFTQTLAGMHKAKFFGKNLEKAYVGKREERDGKKHIQRMILLRDKADKKEEENHKLYLIDTSSLNIEKPTAQMLIDKLNSGEFIYENDEHKLVGIDKGEPDDTTK